MHKLPLDALLSLSVKPQKLSIVGIYNRGALRSPNPVITLSLFVLRKINRKNPSHILACLLAHFVRTEPWHAIGTKRLFLKSAINPPHKYLIENYIPTQLHTVHSNLWESLLSFNSTRCIPRWKGRQGTFNSTRYIRNFLQLPRWKGRQGTFNSTRYIRNFLQLPRWKGRQGTFNSTRYIRNPKRPH
jgi:hypothetical protein